MKRAVVYYKPQFLLFHLSKYYRKLYNSFWIVYYDLLEQNSLQTVFQDVFLVLKCLQGLSKIFRSKFPLFQLRKVNLLLYSQSTAIGLKNFELIILNYQLKFHKFFWSSRCFFLGKIYPYVKKLLQAHRAFINCLSL